MRSTIEVAQPADVQFPIPMRGNESVTLRATEARLSGRWRSPGLVDRLVKLPVPSARSLLMCGSRGSSGDVADCRTPR